MPVATAVEVEDDGLGFVCGRHLVNVHALDLVFFYGALVDAHQRDNRYEREQ